MSDPFQSPQYLITRDKPSRK